MLSTQLMKLAEHCQWRSGSDESFIFGEFNGYLFTAFDGKGFKAFITPLAGISKDALDILLRFLRENYRSLRIRNFDVSDNFLCIRMQEGLIPLTADKMEYLLAQVSGLLSLSEMPVSACVVCGEPAPKRGLYYGLFCHLHPECQDRELVDFTGSDYLQEEGTGGIEHLGDVLRKKGAGDPLEDESGLSPEPPADTVPVKSEPEDLSGRLSDLAGTMSGYQDAMIESLEGLCRIPSVKGPAAENAPFGKETAEALRFFLELGERLGFKAVNLDHFCGYVEFGAGDPLIAVLGHLDVVPPGGGWTAGPFEPVVESGRIVCRGCQDDKGPVIAALYAMKSLSDAGFVPEGRIRLIAGLDEESGSGCMDHYVRTAELPALGFTPDADFPVINAEKGCAWLNLTFPAAQSPDDYLRLLSMKAGSAPNMVPASCSMVLGGGGSRQEIVVQGSPAHGSTPWKGRNAITLAMQEAYDRLGAAGSRHPFVDFYREAIGDDWRGAGLGIDGEDESGPLTVNAGMLEMDDTKAVLTLDIRYPVSWNTGFLLAKIREKAVVHGGSLTLLRDLPPLFVPKDAPLVAKLLSTYRDLTGSDAGPLAIGGGTYARAMPNIVAFGPVFPGDSDTAHQADEAISITSLLAASAVYREALRRLAGPDESDVLI